METKVAIIKDINTDIRFIEEAGKVIRNGGTVAFPTETVYGLGANALDDEAVKKIFIAKGRPQDNPLIIHVSTKEISELVKDVPEVAQKIIDKYYEADKTFLQDNFLPNVLGLAKNSSGSQVGIPYSLSTPVLYINKDLLREAGLDENGPKTWEDVKAFADTVKEKTGKYGLYIQEPADNWATQALLESNGARMITDGKASFASEEGIKAYEVYADMVVNTKSALHISWGEGVQSFIDGNVAMLYTTIAQRANVQKGAAFDVAAINSPSWSGKEKRLPAGGCFLAITAQSEEEQKAAWEFEKYLYSVESMAEWTKGTGYVPPRKDVAEAENGLKSFLEENKMMEAATTQMDGVVSWTSFPGDAGLEAEQTLLDTRDKILSGSVSARDGLTKAQEDINVLLSK